MDIKYLNKIAEYYKKEYNLDTFIDICCQGLATYYKAKQDYIYFSLEFVKHLYDSGDLKQRANIKNLEQGYIFTILHELKHAIDYKNKPDRYELELKNVDTLQYYSDRQYHHSQPAEIRADEFARQELEKWL